MKRQQLGVRKLCNILKFLIDLEHLYSRRAGLC
jgi:hypothetical protein